MATIAPQIVYDDDNEEIAIPFHCEIEIHQQNNSTKLYQPQETPTITQDGQDGFDLDCFLSGANGLETNLKPSHDTAFGASINGYSSFGVKTQQVAFDANASISFKGSAFQTDLKSLIVSDDCKEQREKIGEIMKLLDKKEQAKQIETNVLPMMKLLRNDITAAINAIGTSDHLELVKYQHKLSVIEKDIEGVQRQINELKK